MSKLSLFIALLFLLIHQNSKAQTDIQRDRRVNPVLKQVDAKRPGLLMFSRKGDGSKYVNMAVLDESTRKLKWFTCHGVAFDSAQLTNDEYGQVVSKALDPFTFYKNFCYENLFYIERAETLYRLHGKAALQDTSHNNQVVFNATPVKAAQSTLQKLMAIESFMKRICLQLRLFDSRTPRWLSGNRNDSSRIRQELAGVMIRKADSTEYYNTYPLAPAAKIVLRKQAPEKLFVYNQEGALVDSVPLKPGKYASLLKEKEDVFLLYRGWLELQWQQVADSKLQSIGWLRKLDSSLYRSASWLQNKRQLQNGVAELQVQQSVIDDKISSLIVPAAQYVEQLVADFYRNEVSEISYLDGLGFAYSISYVRGQKVYELTDHRGNVMAVVSDKKKGVDENADGVVEYYNADVVNANDYYPFGMLQPGRTFSTENKYRYGYNGKENDNEVKGEGNQQDYGMRIYDPRVGRFLSVDPIAKDFPWYTPYQFAGNTPIWAIDLDGLEPLPLFGFNTPLMGAADLVETGIGETAVRASPFEGAGLGQALSSVRMGPGGSMTQELPFNWRSFGPMPVVPIPQAYGRGSLLKAPDQTSIPQQVPQKSPQPVANPQRQFDPKQAPQKEDNDKDDVYVYRGGSYTDLNFTPAEKDTPKGPKQGWSTFLDPLQATQGQGGKVQALSVKKLKALGFVLNYTPDGHVGIAPKSQKALDTWAATKEPIRRNERGAHLLTKILKKAWVKSATIPKTK